MRSLRKRNANLCAILDMKVSNIDIIDTIADEKKLNMCLIQGWCSKKISQCCPKKQKVRDWTVSASHLTHSKKLKNSYLFTFWSEFMSEYFPKWVMQLFRLSNTDSANRFPFFKKLFILKALNVLGLNNSIELKETMQYYTNLPIFEHSGC